jgi:hypothetical protein
MLGPTFVSYSHARTEAPLTGTASFKVDEAPERLHYSCWNIFITPPVYRNVRRLLPTNVVTS